MTTINTNVKVTLQDKEALQQQQYNNLIQISALQSKLDEVRHGVPVEGTSDQELKEQLQAEQESLERKEGEVICSFSVLSCRLWITHVVN